MNAIQVIQNPSTDIISETRRNVDRRWLLLFDIKAAVDTITHRVSKKPGFATPEQYTHHAYQRGIKYFLNWLGPDLNDDQYQSSTIDDIISLIYMEGAALPSEQTIDSFIHHLKAEQGLSSSTVSSKYLAPLRHFLDGLLRQTPEVHGEEWIALYEYKSAITNARNVKNPENDRNSGKPALEDHGTRLTYAELNTLYERMAQDTDTLTGLRNYAIVVTAFDTCLRVSELSRLTLNSIELDDSGVYTVTVRGKRNNYTPVPMGVEVYQIIIDWVTAYNAVLTDDDPRRITGDTPIWQALMHNGLPCPIDYIDINKGLSSNALRCVFKKVSHQYRIRVTTDNEIVEITPHDARRTTAKMMRDQGAEIEDIQEKLRHSSPITTARYIGRKKDRQKANTSTYVSIDVLINQAHKRPPTPPHIKEAFETNNIII